LSGEIPFSLGFLFRKRIGRLFITTKMKILNETISIDVLSVRSYKTTQVKDVLSPSYRYRIA